MRRWLNSPLICRVLVAGLAALFFDFRVRAQEWHEFPGGRWKELPRTVVAQPGFKLLDPASTGVQFVNSLPDEQAATNRTLFNGSGVAAGDIDGDGLPDLVFAGINHQLAVYKNLGAWQFTNITVSCGVVITNLLCRGVVLADITGDGSLDLLVGGTGSGVHCWKNDGRGHFTEMSREAGAASPYASVTLALADVDGNGTVDLYVANNRAEDVRDYGQVHLHSVRGQAVVPPALTNRLTIVNGQLLEYGEPDALYLNDGSGHFHEAGWRNGTFLDESGQPLKGPPLDWGLTATFRDLNGDGAPDIYVCNDFWTPDRIWLNDGKGHFRAAPALAFRQTSDSSMGVDIADLDGDGWPEIFVADMFSRSPAWRKRQMPAQRPVINLPGEIANRPQSPRNTFFHARGDGTYEELANYAGLIASEWAWQPVFIDIDLDGRLDLIITSGNERDVQDRDSEIIIQARQRNYSAITNAVERRRVFSSDMLAHNKVYPKLGTPIVAYRNLDNFHFQDVTEQWGTTQLGAHHGIAFADFDGDGDLDFAVNNLNSTASLYRNEASAPRIVVRLKGLPANTQAIGALVSLRGGATPVQRQEVIVGGRYLSGNDPLLVFAAGTNNTPRSLEVRWRNGKTRTIENIEANRLYEITENSSLDSMPEPTNAPVKPKWFADVTERLGGHVHHEGLYDDFQRQPLLPRRLSQLGPGVAWMDLDGDGWEDLVIGTGAGGSLGVFRNTQTGAFTPVIAAPFSYAQPRDTTTLLGLPRPDGKSSILAGLANYEDGSTNAACLFVFDPGTPGPRAALNDLPSSVGPLALADYDGDGTLDLFIGARVRPAHWPEAGGSLLLKQTNGAWVKDEVNSRVIDSPACVSAAVWSDLNGDGFPELILVGEYSGLRIFRNNRGTFEPWNLPVRATGPLAEISNLKSLSGLWTSVAAGDFDGDSKLDLVLGNWGENGEEKASLDFPLILVAGEFGLPSLATIETTYDSVRHALTPTRPLADLGSGLPFLAGRFHTHREYSEATLDQVLGPEKSATRKFRANTLKSALLLNRGDHFELRELPREAQLAPIFGLCIADLDLDGHEDLFLAQNFFATRPGVPRLDAGRGLLLRGDGEGGFVPVPGQESNLLIYGEQRGAAIADFDHDGRPDLVVTQNAAPTRLFRNITQKSGLRVRLKGPPGNPAGIGASIHLIAGEKTFPVRELHSGSGYWSQDSSIPVLPVPAETGKLRVEVRWPGGKVTQAEVPPNAREIAVSF
ncbi:MAG TPA: FG-GAP-like repeat-containing protein [Verrucomicrobiae bacterium]|nr:FG-GAP-like repeat-containing protein [Verrucomicrobiae bacterium]